GPGEECKHSGSASTRGARRPACSSRSSRGGRKVLTHEVAGKPLGANPITSCCFFRQIPLQFFCQMLAELMRKNGGVEPIERELAPIDHIDERFKDFALLSHFVAEAELLLALDQVQGLHTCCAVAAVVAL